MVVKGCIEVISHSSKQTHRIGIRLGELARAGDLFLLVGELGTGKTCLAQGIAWGLGVDDYAISPSFVLIRQYQGRLPLYHIDFYRLDRPEEVAQLGLDDYLYGEGVSVVEWAEKGQEVLPAEHLLARLEHMAGTRRRLRFQPKGQRYMEMLSQLDVRRG